MKIYALKDTGTSIDEFKERLEEHIDVDFVEIEQSFESVPWEYYEPDELGIEKEWLNETADEIYEVNFEAIDLLFCFVSKENWKNGDDAMWGWHLGNPMHSYETCIVKMRCGYDDTAIHEVMHTLNDLIFVELGIRVEDILEVEDYDRDVVHGKARGYEEYDYEKALDILKPYIHDAVLSRRGKLKRSLKEKLLHLYRRLLKRLRKNVTKIEAPKSRLEKWARGIQKAEGWFEGSVSWRNKNPGNLRFSRFQKGKRDGFAYFESYEDGFNALIYQLELYATGKSAHTTGEETLREWVDIYAPPTDDNAHNDNYARTVARALGVPVTTKINTLI